MSIPFTPANKDGVHSHRALSWSLRLLNGNYYLATTAGAVTNGTVTSGRKAVTNAGTAETIVASSTACFRVELSADLGNTNPVVVGGSTVVAANGSQQGIVLIPGNDPFVIIIDDVEKIYVDSQTNGDSVVFNYYA